MSGPKMKPKPAAPPDPNRKSKSGVLGEFVADLEESLGDGFLQEAPRPKLSTRWPPGPKLSRCPLGIWRPARSPDPASAPPTVAPQLRSPRLRFRIGVRCRRSGAVNRARSARLGAPRTRRPARRNMPPASISPTCLAKSATNSKKKFATADEDPETHYNLGVAFREMGLLDEAIGELQKVCQAVDHGHPFPQVMQTYTWLAQCFLDKGVPEAAIRWYEKALKLPTLDEETRTALHYELGLLLRNRQRQARRPATTSWKSTEAISTIGMWASASRP